MMKKESRTSEDFKMMAAVKKDRNVYKNKQAGCKVKTENMNQDLKSEDRKVNLKIVDSTKLAGNTI